MTASCPTPDTALDTFLATHEETLRSLLGYWPVHVWKVEQFGPLTKYTLGEMPDKRWAMLHHLTQADTGPAHCHPCVMETYLFHPYVERVYQPTGNGYHPEYTLWQAGSTHTIAPECIHQILFLPEGEAWSLVFAGPVVREWRHYSEEELQSKS